MAQKFPSSPAVFLGREDIITRFAARLEHFSLFVYGGLSGIGTTSLALKLASQTKSAGITTGIFLSLGPGEGVRSILTRVGARLKMPVGEAQSDPYQLLVNTLDEAKACLVLDRFDALRREDRSPLTRTAKAHPGTYRIIGASNGMPDFSTMDMPTVVTESVGPLKAEDLERLADKHKLGEAATAIIMDDAKRGGCVLQPLTMHYLLALCGDDMPKAFLGQQTSRSGNAFKALWKQFGTQLDPSLRLALGQLRRIRVPIAHSVATKSLGKPVDQLLHMNLINQVGDDIFLPRPLALQLGNGEELPTSGAATVAKHLVSRAGSLGEPLAIARAGELLAASGNQEAAVKAMADGWEVIKELGFVEAYLKALSGITATGKYAEQLELLAARARMRKGNPASVLADMEQLAEGKDKWAKGQALVALVAIYRRQHEHDKVVDAYKKLAKLSTDSEVTLTPGIQAAEALARLGKIGDAEKLAKKLITDLKGKKDAPQRGELHRMLARLYAQSGQLEAAVEQGLAAAKSFAAAGDLYHAATAQGFVGDLFRETGDFELAKQAFAKFYELAVQWGDRDLIQIAELAEAWVSIDIGDLTHAAQKVADVEKEMGAAPSKRLRRYLAAAKALVAAGRGRHREASSMLVRVIDAWDTAGQRAIADILRAQLVRSLIACGQIVPAEKLVTKTLARLDAKVAAPRVAALLRESALIRLRRKDVKKAMADFAQARKLFSQGGNRREEALTLHRIAHAALGEGDLELAEKTAAEALSLAKQIKHQRAYALAREVQGRVALANNQGEEACLALTEASQMLRKLGDDVGTLHVSEWLLRAQIFAGDLASAMRQGPKVRTHAEKVGIQDIYVRATALHGVALLRRARMDAASRCFKELDLADHSPLTVAVMWRLGEALASIYGKRSLCLERRVRWVEAVAAMPKERYEETLHILEQLILPPQDQSILQTAGKSRALTTEQFGWLDLSGYKFVVDVLNQRTFTEGKRIDLPSQELKNFLNCLVTSPKGIEAGMAYEESTGKQPDGKPERAIKPLIRDLKKALRKIEGFNVTLNGDTLQMEAPRKYAYLIPTFLAAEEISEEQRLVMQLLGRFGTVPIQMIQDQFQMTRTVARRELGELAELNLVEAVRDGRGQAFRLK